MQPCAYNVIALGELLLAETFPEFLPRASKTRKISSNNDRPSESPGAEQQSQASDTGTYEPDAKPLVAVVDNFRVDAEKIYARDSREIHASG